MLDWIERFYNNYKPPDPSKENQSAGKQYTNSVYYERTGMDLLDVIKSRGSCGELRIAMMLMKHFNPIHVFPNVYIPKLDGSTTEIDAMLLTTKKIYIIEAKNWAGKIYGTQNSKHWKQYINGHQNEYYNPVKQNWSHFYTFRDRFNIPQERIVPFVVFNDLSELHITVTSMPVIKRSELLSFIDERQTKATDYFSLYDLDRLSKELTKFIHLDAEQKNEHVKTIQTKQAGK